MLSEIVKSYTSKKDLEVNLIEMAKFFNNKLKKYNRIEDIKSPEYNYIGSSMILECTNIGGTVTYINGNNTVVVNPNRIIIAEYDKSLEDNFKHSKI